MNTGKKGFNKILVYQIYQYIKTIIHCDQVGFIPGIKFNIQIRIESLKDKNTLTISVNAEKALDKLQHLS